MPLLLTILSSILYISIFPKFSFWPLSIIALIPLFYSLEKCKNYISAFFTGFLWMSIVASGMGYWLYFTLTFHYSKPFYIAALFILIGLILPLAITYGLFGISYRYLTKNRPLFYLLIVPSMWIIAEYLREIIPQLLPWGFAGYGAPPVFLQISDITGIYGVSFLIVFINSTLFYIFKDLILHDIFNEIKEQFINKKYVIATLIVIIISVTAYGQLKKQIVKNSLASAENSQKIDVTIVQGNYTQKERWTEMGFMIRIKSYLKMSYNNKSSLEQKIILWPETVLNSSKHSNKKFFQDLSKQLQKNSLLIAGGIRKQRNSPPYNTAYMISDSGAINYYDKNILLPYAETFPIESLMGDYYNAPSSFIEGKTGNTIRTPYGTGGITICFESIYPWYVRESVLDGAEFLVNISNDTWFGKSAQPYLHLKSSSIRAIENRRYLLRASNSGISAIINPIGNIEKKTRLFTKKAISGQILKLKEKTIYTQFGDWILFFASGIILISLIIPAMKKDEGGVT